jgi:hypothetical protein
VNSKNDSRLTFAQINAGIQAADSAIVNNDTKTTFKNADEWLTQKQQQASPGSTNGKA